MSDFNLLKEKIKQSGYKMNYIASQLGITYQGLQNKLNGSSEFKISEVQSLFNLLNLTDEEKNKIFF